MITKKIVLRNVGRANYEQIAINVVFKIDTLRNAHHDRISNVSMLMRFFFYHSLCRSAGVDSQAPILNSEMRNAVETIAPAAMRSISREYRVAAGESSRLPDRELLSATDTFESHRNFFADLYPFAPVI